MKQTRYIASCKFSLLHPELSLSIQRYLAERFGVETMRFVENAKGDVCPAHGG